MADKKKEQLTKGLAALFGEAPTATAKEAAPQPVQTEEDILDSLQDAELRERLSQRRLARAGRPKAGRPKSPETAGTGRVCAIVNLEKWQKVKYISLQETMQIKEVLDLALDMVIAEYEQKKGSIKLPKRNKNNNVFNK